MDRPKLTHISLYSGIGGEDLASQWAGFRNIASCEINPYCQSVLKYHFPGIPIIGDIHDITRQSIIAYTNEYRKKRNQSENWEGRRSNENHSEIIDDSEGGKNHEREPNVMGEKTIRGKGINPASSFSGKDDGFRLTLLSGGIPCQPASIAGKRRGKNDNRWLWPEAIRVLGELQPTWAVFENPAGIATLDEYGGKSQMEDTSIDAIPNKYSTELINIIEEIEQKGYIVQSVCIPACAVNAPHRRDRIFIIAYSRRQYGTRAENNGELDRLVSETQNASLFKRPDSNDFKRFITLSGGFGCDNWGDNWQKRYFQADKWLTEENKSEWQRRVSWTSLASPTSTHTSINGSKTGIPKQAQREEGNSGLCYSPIEGLPNWAGGKVAMPEPLTKSERSSGKRSIVESFRYVDDGISDRLARLTRRERIDRLKALGNANPPELYYPIFKAIADIEIQSRESRG